MLKRAAVNYEILTEKDKKLQEIRAELKNTQKKYKDVKFRKEQAKSCFSLRKSRGDRHDLGYINFKDRICERTTSS